MDDQLLLPFPGALPRRRTVPPACRVPLSRAERVDLLLRRNDAGFLLWNPADKLDSAEMSREGFAGEPRNDNGTDKAPRFASLEEMADAIAQRQSQRRGAA